MDKLEHLKQMVLENIDREKAKISLSSNREIFCHHVLFLKGINAVFFLNSYYINSDLQTAKDCLYKIGMTNAYYHEVYNGEIFNVLDTFVYPVLAGSQSLIDRYLRYTKTQHEDSFSTYFGKAVQCLWRKDEQGLAGNITGMEKWENGKWEKSYSGIVRAFKGFINKDAQAITDGIDELIAKHDAQNQPGIIKDYINFEAAAIAKLAIDNGYILKDAERLIPYDLLRATPNEQYEGYAFFDEIG
jgi:hypothetical protein